MAGRHRARDGDPVAARGGREPAGDAESREGAVVFPVAPGNRGRHDGARRSRLDQRRARRRRPAAGVPAGG